MLKENRQAKRVIRPLNIKFSINQENPLKWNLSSVIGDISLTGVKFIAPSDLKDQIVFLEISSPRLNPRTLKLEAMVVDSRPSEHPSYFDIRAKFINLTKAAMNDLAILESDNIRQ